MMKEVNAHICPTCGGKLIVDVDRQMYECPYCGVSFDYDYFREESVLGIAARALENNEFDSASRAYDFMLEKEPDNFEALRGKALIAMNITKIDDIRTLDLYSKIDCKSASEEIEKGIGSSKPQDREYFTTMKDIVDAGHEYIVEKAEVKRQTEKKEISEDRINAIAQERDKICIYSSPGFGTKKAVFLTVLGYILVCLIFFAGYWINNRNPYSKAEDLSQYETTQTSETYSRFSRYSTSDSLKDIGSWYSNHEKYQEALKREEQRKINYETWEKEHKPSAKIIISILITISVLYVVVIVFLFRHGKSLNAEIAKLQAEADEHSEKIRVCETRIADCMDRISQGYKRLCELHPVSE